MILTIILLCLMPQIGLTYSSGVIEESFVMSAEVTFLPPGSGNLVHEPIDIINIVNDQIVIEASIDGYSGYTNLILWYRISGQSSYIQIPFNPVPQQGVMDYSGEAIIPTEDVTTAGVEYFITAAGPTVTAYTEFSINNPHQIKYVEEETLVYGPGNKTITLQDGNIYDGESEVTIHGYTVGGSVSFKQLLNLNDLPKNNNYYVLYNTAVAAYQLEPSTASIKDNTKLTLLYMDINRDGSEDLSSHDEKKLRLFWFDGFDWRYMGGKVNPSKNVVSSSIFTFGVFGLFPISALPPKAHKPLEKFVTPNGDGINDYLIFNGLSGDFSIKIVDIKGNLIRQIDDKPYWDGKDKKGKDVSGGVYFYQLKLDKEIIKGTIIIAR